MKPLPNGYKRVAIRCTGRPKVVGVTDITLPNGDVIGAKVSEIQTMILDTDNQQLHCSVMLIYEHGKQT